VNLVGEGVLEQYIDGLNVEVGNVGFLQDSGTLV